MERTSNHKYILKGSEVRSINNTKLVEGGTRLVTNAELIEHPLSDELIQNLHKTHKKMF